MIIDIGAAGDAGAVITLLAVSLFSFVVGTVFRRWPDKVQEYVEDFDGFVYFLSPEAHRSGIQLAGIALMGLSIAALFGAARFL